LKQFGEFILRYPKSVLYGIAAVALLSIYPASEIRTDFNLEGFYPEDDRVIEDYRALEEEFGRDDDTIIIGLRSDSLFSKPVLSDMRKLTFQLDSLNFISETLSIWNVSEMNIEGNNLDFKTYLNNDMDSSELLDVRKRMSSDPLLQGLILNEEGTVTSFILRIDSEQNTYQNRNELILSIQSVLDEYRDRYEFHISGIPYYRNQYVNMLNGEIVMYIAISSILIILLLWYLYRTIWGVLFPMIIVWSTLLVTVALIHISGGFLEIMSSTIAPILLCVGVADAVHMISKFDDARESDLSKRESIIEMLKTLGSATFLTSVTTAIGFATLLSSSVMPMQRFGAYTAAGVLIAYLITIFFLPAALSLSRKSRVFNEKSGALYPLLTRWLNRLIAFNRLHYGKLLTGALLLVFLFSFGIQNIEINGRVFDDVGEDSELMQDSRFFAENLSPQFPMEFIIDTGEPDGALTFDMHQKSEKFTRLLQSFPEIHKVTGLNTLMDQIHNVMNPDARGFETLSDPDASIAQYALLLEINAEDELFGFVDFDYRKVRITALTEDAGSKRMNEIRENILNEASAIFDNESIIVTGTTILSADLTEKIVYSLSWSILLAIIAITLIMMALFRSFKLAIIALIPNLLPLVMVAGVMGFLNVDIKPSTAVIFTIALGIAVDDSIHYLARFRIEYARIGAVFPALAATTLRTGRAIVVTSLILIAGFGTLVTSAFTSTAMMGVLVTTTIFSALLADLFILPALFYWLKPKLKNIKP
jgi:uncharacterized protein